MEFLYDNRVIISFMLIITLILLNPRSNFFLRLILAISYLVIVTWFYDIVSILGANEIIFNETIFNESLTQVSSTTAVYSNSKSIIFIVIYIVLLYLSTNSVVLLFYSINVELEKGAKETIRALLINDRVLFYSYYIFFLFMAYFYVVTASTLAYYINLCTFYLSNIDVFKIEYADLITNLSDIQIQETIILSQSSFDVINSWINILFGSIIITSIWVSLKTFFKVIIIEKFTHLLKEIDAGILKVKIFFGLF